MKPRSSYSIDHNNKVLTVTDGLDTSSAASSQVTCRNILIRDCAGNLLNDVSYEAVCLQFPESTPTVGDVLRLTVNGTAYEITVSEEHVESQDADTTLQEAYEATMLNLASALHSEVGAVDPCDRAYGASYKTCYETECLMKVYATHPGVSLDIQWEHISGETTTSLSYTQAEGASCLQESSIQWGYTEDQIVTIQSVWSVRGKSGKEMRISFQEHDVFFEDYAITESDAVADPDPNLDLYYLQLRGSVDLSAVRAGMYVRAVYDPDISALADDMATGYFPIHSVDDAANRLVIQTRGGTNLAGIYDGPYQRIRILISPTNEFIFRMYGSFIPPVSSPLRPYKAETARLAAENINRAISDQGIQFSNLYASEQEGTLRIFVSNEYLESSVAGTAFPIRLKKYAQSSADLWPPHIAVEDLDTHLFTSSGDLSQSSGWDDVGTDSHRLLLECPKVVPLLTNIDSKLTALLLQSVEDDCCPNHNEINEMVAIRQAIRTYSCYGDCVKAHELLEELKRLTV